MMNLANLDSDGRKRYYRIVPIGDFRKFLNRVHAKPNVFVSKMKKSYDRITTKDLEDYLEKNYTNSDDPIAVAYSDAVNDYVNKRLPQYSDLIRLINGKSYTELDDQLKAEIEKYRADYEFCKFKMTFDDLIKVSCKVDEEDYKKENQKEKQAKETLASLEKIKRENNNLSLENNRLKKQIKKITEDNKREIASKEQEYKKLQSDFKQYKERFTSSSVATTLSKILNHSISGQTYEQIYSELTSIENEASNKDDYSDLENILAAKYAIAKIKKGIN